MKTELTRSIAWQELMQHRDALKAVRLSGLVLGDPQRLDNCELAVGGLRLNYALQNVAPETLVLLIKLARQQKVEEWRARMIGGEKINTSENRAVLHMALRQLTDRPVMFDGHDVLPDIKAARERMADIVNDVRQGHWKGATGKSIKHIVNIGIGGSDLGPRLAVHALARDASGPRVHFVANADAFDITSVIGPLNPEETLFVVVSKTFTTQETLLNAQTARSWLTDKLGEKAVAQHFIAVSVNADEVRKFGIDVQHMLPMWDWVGGRFSLWSAVGLSVALAIGTDDFEKMLAGAAAMDEHFLTVPLDRNMPVILALLGVWNGNFLGASAQAVLPYCERLRELPRYLQQLEMESNGKSVTRHGSSVDYATAPVIFGECGTVGQHSFHQWLHQGSQVIPADFIGVAADDLNLADHHRAMQSNMAAQACALAFGEADAAAPQDRYAGNRPSNILMLDRLDPYHLGMLLALYEHKTFVQGIVWNINSFDQPGVELGKKMARALASGSTAKNAAGAFTARVFERFSSR